MSVKKYAYVICNHAGIRAAMSFDNTRFWEATHSKGNQLRYANTDLYLESEQRIHAFNPQFIDKLFVQLVLDERKALWTTQRA